MNAACSTQELAHWALQFTPYVSRFCVAQGGRAWDAVLMDARASLRLWGGLPRLLGLLREQGSPLGLARLATGLTGAVALARLHAQNSNQPIRQVDDLPLAALPAAWPHLDTLQQMGCATWGQLAAMPRGGITRRFGTIVLHALDQAYGRKSEAYSWIASPEVFAVSHELHANVENASGLLAVATPQLMLLQAWLRVRHQGVLSCQFTWLLDARRNCALRGELILQTAQPTQDVEHIERLLSEHLAQIELPAPAHTLQLRSLRCEALPQITKSLLIEEQHSGEPLHFFIERVASKLGADAICRPILQADHRPEHAQRWLGAASSVAAVRALAPMLHGAHLYRPAWLMRQPLRLLVQSDKPYYQGKLQLMHGPERVESSILVDAVANIEPQAVARDYFIAWNASAGLLWIFRERLIGEPGWYLQGLFA